MERYIFTSWRNNNWLAIEMIIKFLLSILCIILISFILFQRATSRIFQIIVIIFLIFGSYLIWFPQHSTEFANFLGVGRGVDLVIYFWIIMSFACFLILYLRLLQLEGVITKLARSIALSRPVVPSQYEAAEQRSFIENNSKK